MKQENIELKEGDPIDIGGFVTTLKKIEYNPMAKVNFYWFYDERGEYKYNLKEFIRKVPELKPSMFMNIPWGSTLQKMECELVAKNIMVILSRTGDTFRDLSWEEYKFEREKDTGFSDFEKKHFDQVVYLSLGERTQVLGFSPDWKSAYMKILHKSN